MKLTEIISKAEAVKTHQIATPNERQLAALLIDVSNKVISLESKIAKLEGSPLPPGSQ